MQTQYSGSYYFQSTYAIAATLKVQLAFLSFAFAFNLSPSQQISHFCHSRLFIFPAIEFNLSPSQQISHFRHSRLFIFPAIESPVETLLTASFHHLEEIFCQELHMPVKLAHKLSHRVLHPGRLPTKPISTIHKLRHKFPSLKYHSQIGGMSGFRPFSGLEQSSLARWKALGQL